jgi:hypothetical protein
LPALLHCFGKKAFEEKPIISTWATVTCVRKSYQVGISDPSRPGFPELGVSVFSNNTFYTNIAEKNLQQSFITYPTTKVNKITANPGS